MHLLHVKSNHSPAITEGELRTILDVSHEEGVIESEERQMITNVVDFGDSMAKDVMVPKMDVGFVVRIFLIRNCSRYIRNFAIQECLYIVKAVIM